MSKKSVLQKQFVVYGADSVLGHFVHCISSHFVHVTLLLINTTSLVVFDCQNKKYNSEFGTRSLPLSIAREGRHFL